METFSALLALCVGNSPVFGEFPHKGQWRGALMFSLICAWINAWVKNREAGDLRRHRAHYDVTVMSPESLTFYKHIMINQTYIWHICLFQCKKNRKLFTGPTCKLFVSFTVVSGIYWSFIPKKTIFTKHFLSKYWFQSFYRSRAWQIILILHTVMWYQVTLTTYDIFNERRHQINFNNYLLRNIIKEW